MRLTIGKRIIVGFAASLIVTIVLGLFAYYKTNAIEREMICLATDAMPGIAFMGDIDSHMQENAKLTLRSITAVDKADLAEVEKDVQNANRETNKSFKDYEGSITQDEDRRNFNKLVELRQNWLPVKAKIIKFSGENKDKEALELFCREGVPMLRLINDQTDLMSKWNRDYGDAAIARGTTAVSSAKTGIVVAVALAVVIAAGLGLVVTTTINRALSRMSASLGEGSGQVASASTQVSSASQSLAQGASEQASSLEETSSALEEITSMTKRNADTARQAAALSGQAKDASDKGNLAMEKMGQAIAQIEKSATETAKIIRVIDEIAMQTNLLALNAAVEAARAGEAGKGFAVVAEEVRNLAMRSAEAAKTTNAMIEQSVTSARNGVAISADVAKTLGEITEAATRVNTLVGEIAAASGEQAQGIDQINNSVSQMDKVTQATAAGAEQAAAASEELSAQAEEMSATVRALNSLITGALVPPTQTRSIDVISKGRRVSSTPTSRKTIKPKPASSANRAESAIPFGLPDEQDDAFSDFTSK